VNAAAPLETDNIVWRCDGDWVAFYECPEHGEYVTAWAIHPLDHAALFGDLPDAMWELADDDPSLWLESCPHRGHHVADDEAVWDWDSERFVAPPPFGRVPEHERLHEPTLVSREGLLTDADRARLAAIREQWAPRPRARLTPEPSRSTTTGQELADADDPDVTCLTVFGRDGIVVVGWAHLVSAPAKAGKTTLLGHLVQDWLEAGHRVRWLTEEPKSVWRKRIRRLRRSRPDVDWSRLTVAFPGDDERTTRADAFGSAEQIVIVDTIRAFIPCENENDAAERARGLRPWVNAAHETGKTVIFVVHARKGGGQHGEAVAGTHELVAAVDQIIEVTRVGDDESRRRKLTTLGREFEPVAVLYGMDTEGGIYEIGDARTVQQAEYERSVVAAMQPGVAMSTAEVGAEMETRQAATSSTLKRALHRLCESGRAERTPPYPEPARGKDVKWTRRAGTD
jgi:hypothetical protein